MDYVQDLWKQAGIMGPFFTADALELVNENNHPDGAAVGINGHYSEEDFKKAN